MPGVGVAMDAAELTAGELNPTPMDDALPLRNGAKRSTSGVGRNLTAAASSARDRKEKRKMHKKVKHCKS